MINKNGKIHQWILIVMVVIVLVLMAVTGIMFANVSGMKKQLKENTAILEETTKDAEEEKAETEDITIYLPKTYYAATGLTMEIYNSQITSQCGHITDYNVLWSCDVGESLERKFSVTATDDMIGDYDLTVSVYDNALNLLAERTCTLSIVKGSLNREYSFLEFGDSLSCDGALYRRLQGLAEDQLIFNGTRSIDGFLMEGRRGFSAEDYLNETLYHIDPAEECHPFYNPATESFDWNYYIENTGFAPEIIQIFLGTNNLYAGEQNADDIVSIIDNIRMSDITTPIFVVNTIFQSGQNGIGSWSSKSGQLLKVGEYKQEADLYVHQLMLQLQERLEGYDNLYIVPAGISMDSAYNFSTEERPANPYSDQTETYETDPVHPNSDGYYQIADVMFSTMCGVLNDQSTNDTAENGTDQSSEEAVPESDTAESQQ